MPSCNIKSGEFFTNIHMAMYKIEHKWLHLTELFLTLNDLSSSPVDFSSKSSRQFCI